MQVNNEIPLFRLAARGSIGGILMGLANLVPGISGGTMLLAAGVYPDFIAGIAEVVTLKFRKRSLLLLATVVGTAILAILLFAGTVKDLVVDHRWAMYSLFIGLTLGGIPIVRDLLGRSDRKARLGMALGFAGMVALAWFQAHGAGSGADRGGFAWMFLAGITGASAMILPGVSGGYLLLVMGAYVPILSGIDAFKSALEATDLQAMWNPVMTVVLPVGLGVLAGVVLVSNALRYFLDRHRNLTLGVLLGLLVGAVVGLYPFQQGVRPELGDIVKGQVVDAQSLAELDPEDWPTQTFRPTATQLGGSAAFVLIGLAVTSGVRKLGDGPSGNSRPS